MMTGHLVAVAAYSVHQDDKRHATQMIHRNLRWNRD
jgi:hypothetical protein